MNYNSRISTLAIPPRVKRLPISSEGWPVPWFVAWIDGQPDFRVIDTPKLGRAVRERRCWVCGDVLGQNKAFPIGPMCAINRVISEPPSHRECAIFSARACPFLSQPRMRRNEKNLIEQRVDAPGFGLKRNPGAVCVWITREFKVFQAKRGVPGILFHLGDPVECLWFANGREATRAEVLASIDSGYPSLLEVAKQQGAEAVAELERYRAEVMPLLPLANLT
jgi:hypothetical protein